MSNPDLRRERGEAIFQLDGQIKRIDAISYQVNSQSGNGQYDVLSGELGWICSCPDHIHRGVKCKHVWAVEFSLTLRREVQTHTIIQPINALCCIFCSSKKIIRYAMRHNKSGDLQRYLCKMCGRRFSVNLGFEKMKATPQAITGAMQLYFTGESFRNVQNFLRLQGVNVSHVAVYKWIGKYVKLMDEYLQKIKPQLSDTWRADELYLKVKGNRKYLYALMDDETRFWIAQQISDTKYTEDVRPLLREGKIVAGKRPKTFITDGAHNFHQAYLKEYWTARKATRTEHIAHIHLAGDMNNNKMERMNGEVRDREKTMRGLKKMDTPILKGYQIFHNYIRPHLALESKTPGENAGIQIEGENKWITLIQNASHHPTVNRESNHPKT